MLCILSLAIRPLDEPVLAANLAMPRQRGSDETSVERRRRNDQPFVSAPIPLRSSATRPTSLQERPRRAGAGHQERDHQPKAQCGDRLEGSPRTRDAI
jgi:hypothetical protein